MAYYRVDVLEYPKQEWSPIKPVEFVSGQIILRLTPYEENLSRDQAEERCALLSAKYSSFTFRVVEVGS